jgi:MinD superfamily P-loop ATPase
VIVAIASGKGGTGKTTVAVSLALGFGREVQLLDCDVEAPNDHLFLNPVITSSEPAGIPVPRVDPESCSLCGECTELCQFNALAVLRDSVLVFDELCHGCGGCAKVCPEQALSEEMRPIGVVERGRAEEVRLVQGRLDVGEPMAPPLIRAVKGFADPSGVVLIDAPPGTSCPMITAVRGSDLVLLVTEPTPFGLNDLALAVEAVRVLGLPCGVILNRAGSGDDRVHRYCVSQGLEILLEIPDDRRIAEASTRGETALDAVPEMRPTLAAMARRIESWGRGAGWMATQGGPIHADL